MQMKFISRKHVTLLVMSLLLVSSSYQAKAQQGFVHESSTEYQWPEEKGVLKKLDAWQDQKFGVLFHWGCIPFRVLLNHGLSVLKMLTGFQEIVQLHMKITKEIIII